MLNYQRVFGKSFLTFPCFYSQVSVPQPLPESAPAVARERHRWVALSPWPRAAPPGPALGWAALCPWRHWRPLRPAISSASPGWGVPELGLPIFWGWWNVNDNWWKMKISGILFLGVLFLNITCHYMAPNQWQWCPQYIRHVQILHLRTRGFTGTLLFGSYPMVPLCPEMLHLFSWPSPAISGMFFGPADLASSLSQSFSPTFTSFDTNKQHNYI